jgi:hypothetical protein
VVALVVVALVAEVAGGALSSWALWFHPLELFGKCKK